MIVVLGRSGQLSTAFGRLLGDEAVLIGKDELNLAHHRWIRPHLDRYPADVLINCAAYTAVDLAEDEEDKAFSVNATAVGELAAWAAERKIPFVTFSTDYVFDGSSDRPYVESDPTSPINAYGRSKLEGERLAQEAHPGALVIRTSWLVSGSHPNFLVSVLRKAAEGPFRVVNDQTGCPTVAADLAQATLDALAAGAEGTLHITNRGATTWFDFAREALGQSGFDPALVQPCATADFPTRAARPAYSVLGSERIADFGVTVPPWPESLRGVMEELFSWVD